MKTKARAPEKFTRAVHITFYFSLHIPEVKWGKKHHGCTLHGYTSAAVWYILYVFVTFADRQGAAPLSVESTLSTSVSTEDVTSVTGEVDNIIEVELGAIGAPIGWVARVTTSDSWGNREKHYEKFDV